jgi:hypothetical protein
VTCAYLITVQEALRGGDDAVWNEAADDIQPIITSIQGPVARPVDEANTATPGAESTVVRSD